MLDKTFKKEERLSGKLAVSKLFTSGKSFFLHPFLIYYFPHDPSVNLTENRILITVSKKNYKRAVHRNLLKRRIREAYRILKPEMTAHLNDKHYDVGLVYISKEIHTFDFIRSKMKKLLEKMAEGNE
ncbi:ribonuclease P protein component [Saccharicrinis sp. FJH2]|uniref:ribonuclease P protein component n=1 Tax=Saccharicrinis sp. FJH65 TaxID=3344659 RepID=UPI0035F4293B